MTDKPVHDIRFGRIRASIWQNALPSGPAYSVTFSRLYKTDAGEWADSTSFDRDDLLVLAKVADHAHTWVCEQRARGRAAATADAE